MNPRPDPRPLHRKKRTWLLAAALAVLALGWTLYARGIVRPEQVIAAMQAYPVAAPLLFFAGGIVMTVLLLPVCFLFNVAAGVIWGTWWGGVITTVTLTVSAAIAFLFARAAGQEAVEGMLSRWRMRWVMEALRDNSWTVVFLSRINPVVPFGPANYFFGLTPVPFRRFLSATAVGNFLPALLNAAIGASLGTIAVSPDIRTALWQTGLIVLALSVLYLTRLFARARAGYNRHPSLPPSPRLRRTGRSG